MYHNNWIHIICNVTLYSRILHIAWHNTKALSKPTALSIIKTSGMVSASGSYDTELARATAYICYFMSRSQSPTAKLIPTVLSDLYERLCAVLYRIAFMYLYILNTYCAMRTRRYIFSFQYSWPRWKYLKWIFIIYFSPVLFRMSVVCVFVVCITTPEALVQQYNVSYMICRSGGAGFVLSTACTSVSKSILAPLSDIAFARRAYEIPRSYTFTVAYYRIDTRRVIKHV